MKLARMVAALLFLALVLGSAAKSIPSTAIAWHGERVRFEHYSATERAHAPAKNSMPLDARVFDAWRAQLRPGDTFALQFHLKNDSLRESIALYTRFALLPHVQVEPDKADVVLSLFANPRELRLHYTRIVKISNALWAARVKHGH